MYSKSRLFEMKNTNLKTKHLFFIIVLSKVFRFLTLTTTPTGLNETLQRIYIGTRVYLLKSTFYKRTTWLVKITL